MSKELEVRAWEYRHNGWATGVMDVILNKPLYSDEKWPLCRIAEAQAEIAGLKTYAATIAAERDAKQSEIDFEEKRFNDLSDAFAAVVAERDALAKELAEARERENNAQCSRCGSRLFEAKAQSGPVGEVVGDVTIDYFRGNPGMANVRFDYYGNLPEGTHLLYTHPPAAIPEGMVLVPKVPTEEMLFYGHMQIDFDRSGQNTYELDHSSQTEGGSSAIRTDMYDCWNAMLSAAPKP